MQMTKIDFRTEENTCNLVVQPLPIRHKETATVAGRTVEETPALNFC